ncbi:MAG: hypothetical protein LBQ83_01520 [Candidatus Margulisbacteria bacterium]|jgi:outer membrane protein assembly factor BamB|nr:hypothetical protein [Candidatus Margulisiibacteriota bacterium]
MRHLLLWSCLGLLLLTPAGALAEPAQPAAVRLKLRQTLNLQRTTRQPNALVADGRFIYVTDKTGGLCKYDAEGTLVTELQRVNNDFFIASDLAQDNEYLYLPDELSKSIIKISKRLDLSNAHKLDLKNVELLSPAGIYVAKNQDIYLTDSTGDQVYCFNAFGLLEWRRGLFGDAPQSLNTPRAVVMYANSPVVLDSGNNAVKQITAARISSLVSYPGLLSLAAYQDKLFIGTKQGIYLYPSGELLSTPQNVYPEDLFSLNDSLYVLDSQQRKILIYEIY